jgi:hypothetical protein
LSCIHRPAQPKSLVINSLISCLELGIRIRFPQFCCLDVNSIHIWNYNSNTLYWTITRTGLIRCIGLIRRFQYSPQVLLDVGSEQQLFNLLVALPGFKLETSSSYTILSYMHWLVQPKSLISSDVNNVATLL